MVAHWWLVGANVRGNCFDILSSLPLREALREEYRLVAKNVVSISSRI